LAQDKQLAKYVAIKVSIADHSSQEVNILSQFSTCAVKNVQFGRSLIPQMLDCFNLNRLNRTYLCFITAPARCNVA
ncbi:protein kinase domain-containing protein, partial [Colletotrichum graminicola M1.001]